MKRKVEVSREILESTIDDKVPVHAIAFIHYVTHNLIQCTIEIHAEDADQV